VPELWIPGVAGPHEDFVGRIHRQIQRFAQERGIDQAIVEIELRDGARYTVCSLSPEPGFGFVTLALEEGEDAPAELIVPIGPIDRKELYKAREPETRVGFSLSAAPPATAA